MNTPLPPPAAPPAPAAAAPATTPARVYRKVTKNGNSLTVAIPGIFLRTLSLIPGDTIELTLDREWNGFFVRPVPRVPPPPVTPAAPPPAPEAR